MSKGLRIAVSRALPSNALERLAPHCELQVLEPAGVRIEGKLQPALASFGGLICLLTDRIDEPLLDAMPALEFVSSVSVGVDHVDVAALTARGIALGNTPGVLVETTADQAFALLLAAARRVAEADRFVRDGQWCAGESWSPEFFLGKDVGGATIGIVGLGPIGQAVARRAQGFGMEVLGWTSSGREVAGVTSVSLEALLARSDFVSLHLALVESTRQLMNAQRFSAMKAGSVLVNTARGGIVDEAALADALNSGHLFAAGLDVFASEPLAQDSLLLQHPKVVVAPHLGSATTKTRARMIDLAVENARLALAGSAMAHCVNPEVYHRA